VSQPRTVPGKLVAMASPAPEVIYLLDDLGALWACALSPQGEWTWKAVEMPQAVAQPGVRPVEGAPQWKPFGSEP
jgi:hypothetical protein